jgi:triacylglycerol lipase
MATTANMNPVVLIHGLGDTALLFRHLIPRLQREGLQAHALNLIPNNGDAGLDELADQLANYIRAGFPPHQTIDLVGFSMGGLVARYYLQRLKGAERVERFITIASPHNGTLAAFFRANPGARQMRPGSHFLKDLNRDASLLERIRVTSIWTPFDLMIVPARSSHWGVGRSIRVNVAAHALMARDTRVLELVYQLLVENPS